MQLRQEPTTKQVEATITVNNDRRRHQVEATTTVNNDRRRQQVEATTTVTPHSYLLKLFNNRRQCHPISHHSHHGSRERESESEREMHSRNCIPIRSTSPNFIPKRKHSRHCRLKRRKARTTSHFEFAHTKRISIYIWTYHPTSGEVVSSRRLGAAAFALTFRHAVRTHLPRGETLAGKRSAPYVPPRCGTPLSVG